MGAMAKVRPEVKEKLVADGRWKEFVRFRQERIHEGVSPVEAIEMAIAAVCPEFAESRARAGSGSGRKLHVVTKEEAVAKVEAAGEKVDALVAKRKAKAEAELFGAEAFAGKTDVPLSEQIKWVIRNLSVKVKPEDAPGRGEAWAYLERCRKSADFAEQVLLKYMAVQLKGSEDGGGPEKWDGVEQYDLAGAMRDAAEGVEV